MKVGRIVGTIVATKKDGHLVGNKLMLTQPLNSSQQPVGQAIVAVDTVGAGIGEIVVFAQGSPARMAAKKMDAPIDAAIIAIVDNMDVCKDLIYKDAGGDGN